MSSTLYFKQLLAGRDFATSTPFAADMENFVYLIGDKHTRECVVVDPAWNVAELIDIAKADGMTIVGALVTHYHPDHVGGSIFGLNIEGLATLMTLCPCKVHVNEKEAVGVLQMTGLSKSDLVLHQSGDRLQVGGIEVEMLHTPGHTPGSQCFRVKNALISGDTLFLNGCGRVDLPGGDIEQMHDTLSNKLMALPDNVILYPGHAYGGEHAPLADVKTHNRFFKAKDFVSFKKMLGGF
jgi:glyoxylase-like metal-dependent hydrolase (beta-lactamase superfamily II)